MRLPAIDGAHYRIIRAKTTESLEDHVNAAGPDWVPHGDLIHANGMWYQPMQRLVTCVEEDDGDWVRYELPQGQA